MTWRDVAPYKDEIKDRWLRVGWAAKQFSVSRDLLLSWAKDGTVESKVKPTSGHWLVSERSLRLKLFGAI